MSLLIRCICIAVCCFFAASSGHACLTALFKQLSQIQDFSKQNPGITSGQLLCGASKLNLSNLHLTEIPEEIFEMVDLKELWIDNNHISNIPESVSRLKNIEEIYVFNNQLNSLPDSIAKIKSLKKLVVSYNNLSHLPENICNLPRLNTLILDGNNLKDLPNLKDCKELDSLSFAHNHVSSLPAFLADMGKLRWLRASSNNISGITDNILKSSSIKTLIIFDNPFSNNVINTANIKFDIWGPATDNRLWFLTEAGSKQCVKADRNIPLEIGPCNENLETTNFHVQHTLDRSSFLLSRKDECLEIDKEGNSIKTYFKKCTYADEQKFKVWKLPVEGIYQDQIVSIKYNKCMRFNEGKITFNECASDPATAKKERTIFYVRPMLPQLIFSEPISPPPNYNDFAQLFTANKILPKIPYDVILIVSDTLRRDVLTSYGKDILNFFSDENSINPELQWSQATATHLAFFSLFYSQFAFKRDGYLKDQNTLLGAPFLHLLKSSGMDTYFFAHSDLFYCIKNGVGYKKGDVELDQMILLTGKTSSMNTCEQNAEKFQKFYARHENLKSWALKDDLVTDEFLEFNRSSPKSNTPKLSLLYWFSNHYPYSWLENQQGTKAPSFQNDATYETVDWLKNSSDEDVRRKFKNSYNNSVLGVNKQFIKLVNDQVVGPKLRKNTIVVFMADHGENLYEQNYLQHGGPGFASLMNVPIMIRLPDGHPYIKKPHRNFIRTIDVIPTLVDLLGVPDSDLKSKIMQSFDGKSIYNLDVKKCNITVTPNGYDKYPDQLVITSASAKLFAEFAQTQVPHGSKALPASSKALSLYLITDLKDNPIYLPEGAEASNNLENFSSSIRLLLKNNGLDKCIEQLFGKNYREVKY